MARTATPVFVEKKQLIPTKAEILAELAKKVAIFNAVLLHRLIHLVGKAILYMSAPPVFVTSLFPFVSVRQPFSL